jgi:hypothetical protein
LFFILSIANTDLGIGMAPSAHPRSLFDPIVFLLVQVFTLGAVNPRVQQACHVTNWKLCINSLAPSMETIFQSILIHPISDIVNTCSSHPLQPPPSAPEVSNNPKLADFLKSMVESMEFLKKQNEDLMKQNENLDNRLIAAEARSSQKEKERAERHEKERRDRVHRGKRLVNPHQEDNESTV